MTAAGRLRRAPVQSRSRARVERILDAAREIVREGGVAAATTRAIADRAGVSGATLYQFFANRDAVFEQLIARDMERIDQQMAEEAALLRADSIADAIVAFAGLHWNHFLQHTDLVALYFAAGDGEAVRAHQRCVAAMFGAFLIRSGLLPAQTDPRVFGVAIKIAEGTIERAYQETPRNEFVMTQGRIILRSYLEAHRTAPLS